MKKLTAILLSALMILTIGASTIFAADEVNVAAGQKYIRSGIGSSNDENAGEYRLTNGEKGTNAEKFSSGNWIGIYGNSGAAVPCFFKDSTGSIWNLIAIELEEKTKIESVNMVFLMQNTFGIGIPDGLDVYVTDDKIADLDFSTYDFSILDDMTKVGSFTEFTRTAEDAYSYEGDTEAPNKNPDKDGVYDNTFNLDTKAEAQTVVIALKQTASWIFASEVEIIKAGDVVDTSEEESTAVSSTEESSKTESSSTTPTGDAGIYAVAIIALICLAGVAVVKKVR